MTGKAVEVATDSNKGIILIPLIILFVLALLIIFGKKIIKFLSEKMENSHKHPKNSVKGLINKKVYSESGHYIGKVKDIILGENKIENLKIKVDRKHNFKTKGMIINYKQVKSAGEVIIISEKVLEYIENYEKI